MRQLIIHIILLSVLGCLAQISAQEPSAQDDYVNSAQEKYSFNKKKWGSLKDRVIKESGGAYSSENGGVEGSYYNYDNEDYDGKYSEYKNDDDQYLYEGGQAYSEGGGPEGENAWRGKLPPERRQRGTRATRITILKKNSLSGPAETIIVILKEAIWDFFNTSYLGY